MGSPRLLRGLTPRVLPAGHVALDDRARLGLAELEAVGRGATSEAVPPCPDLAREGLRLLDRDVRIGDEGDELVRGVPGDAPDVAPVVRQADGVDDAPANELIPFV